MLSETQQETGSDITSIYDLIFQKNPNNVPCDAPIYFYGDKTVTFGELRDLIHTCAFNLKERFNIQKGDVVALCSRSHINFPVILHAVVFLGGTVALVKQAHLGQEHLIVGDLVSVKAKLFFIDEDDFDYLLQAASKAGIPTSRVLMFGDSCVEAGIDGTNDVLLNGNGVITAPYTFSKEELENHPIYIQYTSGTTGKAKPVTVTANSMIISLKKFCFSKKRTIRTLAYRPFDAQSSVFVYMHVNILLGGEVYISRASTVDEICHDIQKYKIMTITFLSYDVTKMIRKASHIKKTYDLSSLKRVASMSSTLTKEMVQAASDLFGVPIQNIYGSTETRVPFDTTTSISATGSLGKVKDGFSMRIVNEDGNDVAIGELGELLVKGPTVTKGYYLNPEATVKTFTEDGYYRTGDIFMQDKENGYFWFVSRYNYVMKYQQKSFYPFEIEQIVISHPKVIDCAVASISPKGLANDHPRAYVTLVDEVNDENKESIVEDILQFSNKQLSDWKQLRGGIVVRDMIERTPTGKIDYGALKQEIEEEQALALQI